MQSVNAVPPGGEDDRVYCWHCRHRSQPKKIPLWNGVGTGPSGYVSHYTCQFDLAYNPFVKRRCERFLALPLGCISAFPPEYRHD